ncbi:beta strand repeat-containing protein [Methylobacterium sp. Leaf118]|uniref:beta strand repeat-containing protein n=1 Tax=Methylobacterium sp. Leaf118 TaxID=2876562 RepID=UPI001E5D90FD|nr:pre-peptidase C-terminal domain-containing protein [Methylobacterium sp. Leaf118]
MADDFRNTYNGAGALGSLTPGATATGTLEVANDEDIFAIDLVAGRTYTLTMQGASSGFTLADPSFYLRDQVGSAVGFSRGLGGTSTDDALTFTARTSGTYYVDNFGGGGTGSYRLLADPGFIDDYRDSYDDANEALGRLTPGSTATGTLEVANDEDIFAIDLVAGRTYTLTMQGASSGFTLAEPSFYLRDQAGSAVGFSRGIGGTSTDDALTFTARTSGTYYVDTFGGGGTGTYRIQANSGFIDDYRDSYDDTNEALGSLTPGGSATGTLEIANDEDIFAIDLVAGRTYTFTMQGASSGFTLAEPSFYLRDQAGSAVGFSRGLGGTSTDDALTFTVDTSGTYYVDTFGGGGTGSYRLLASSGFNDDYRDTYDDPNEILGRLTPGGSATGTLEIANDQDIFAIDLVAGRTYAFTMQGASSGFTLAEPSFYLRDQAGSAVGFSRGIGGTSTDDALTFTATTSSTYYVDTFGGGGTGTYRVLASSGFNDDYRDSYDDTNEALGSLTAGGTAIGTLELANDQDIFAIDLVAGRTYAFTMQGASSGFTLADPSFYLRDKEGGAVGFSTDADGASTDNTLVFSVTTSGTYYVDAFGDGRTGTYRILASAGTTTPDDYRDTYNDPSEPLGTLSAGDTRTGRIGAAGDRDVFAIALTAGQTYSFDLVSTANGGTALDNAYLRLLNGSGTQILVNDDFNTTNAHLTFKASTGGTYYLEAKSATATGTGHYAISARTGYDDLRNTYNGAGTLGALTVNGSLYGTIEAAGDRDIYKVVLTAGQTYSFDLFSSSNGGAGLDNAYLRLLNGSGTQILVNDDFNATYSHLTFKVVTSGTYYLEAKSATTTGTGNYRISAKTGYDDLRNTYNGSGTLGALTVNGSLYGTIELAGDRDIYKIALTAGETYSFDLFSSSNGGTGLDNAYLRLLNGSGTQILVNDDFNATYSHLTFKATTSGIYYLEARSATTTGTGNYRISAKTDYDDLRNTYNGAGTLGALTVNGSLYGTIERAGDKDLYKIVLTAGETYSFDLASSTNGGLSLDNAYLRLLNSSGTKIFVNDDFNSTNSHLTFKAATSGTYYLEAGSANAGGTGNYLIAFETGYDDLRDTSNGAGTLGTLAINGALYGTVETGSDKDVIAVTLAAGQSYTFDVAGSTNGGAALADAALSLSSSSGTLLRFNDDFNSSNARVTYTATTAGTYYLEVKSATPTGTGSYLITAKRGFDDHADTITDPASPLGVLTIDQNRMGTIETAGDTDMFQFNLVAGHSYALKATGGSSSGVLQDGELHLFNSAGTILAYNDDANGTLNPEIQFTATTTGVHYLEIGGVKTATGTYQLGVFDLA